MADRHPLEDLTTLASMAQRARTRVLKLEHDRTRMANARTVCAALALGRTDYHTSPLPDAKDAEPVEAAVDGEDLEASRMRLLRIIGEAFEAAEEAHDCLAREAEALATYASSAAEKVAAGESFEAHVEKVSSLESEVRRLDVAHRKAVAETGDLKSLLGAYGHNLAAPSETDPTPVEV